MANVLSQRNARFWIYRNDFVKLTLKPNQKIQLYSGGPTEEGHNETYQTYEYENGIVYSEFHNYGCDCDGPYESHSKYYCEYDELQKREVDDVLIPEWKKHGSYQRDHFAEGMGY